VTQEDQVGTSDGSPFLLQKTKKYKVKSTQGINSRERWKAIRGQGMNFGQAMVCIGQEVNSKHSPSGPKLT
jgi:hypothetical protein